MMWISYRRVLFLLLGAPLAFWSVQELHADRTRGLLEDFWENTIEGQKIPAESVPMLQLRGAQGLLYECDHFMRSGAFQKASPARKEELLERFFLSKVKSSLRLAHGITILGYAFLFAYAMVIGVVVLEDLLARFVVKENNVEYIRIGIPVSLPRIQMLVVQMIATRSTVGEETNGIPEWIKTKLIDVLENMWKYLLSDDGASIPGAVSPDEQKALAEEMKPIIAQLIPYRQIERSKARGYIIGFLLYMGQSVLGVLFWEVMHMVFPLMLNSNIRLPVEVAFMRQRYKLSENSTNYILEKLKESYLNTEDKYRLLDEVRQVLWLAQQPVYKGLKADQAFLTEALKAYTPALQEQIRQVVFAIEQQSALIASGQPYERLIILLTGPPGMGKTRIIQLIIEALGLEDVIKVNFEGEDPNILFGTPNELGRITQARLGVRTKTGGQVRENSNIITLIDDVDRALNAKDSAAFLALLDATVMGYYEPYIGGGEHFAFSPIFFMTSNSLPKEQATRDRCRYIIHFDDPFQGDGYQVVAYDYLNSLLKAYAQNPQALTLNDFATEDWAQIKAIVTEAKRTQASIRQVRRQVRSYFYKKWRAHKQAQEKPSPSAA